MSRLFCESIPFLKRLFEVLGYSEIKHIVFTLPRDTVTVVSPMVKLDTRILPIKVLTNKDWKQIKELQGRLGTIYLKWKYGSPETYVLLAYVDKALAHIEWIVPANKIRVRYPFVTEGSYSVISCLTLPRFRGLGIYPSQIQKVVESDIPAKMFWIWTPSTNTPSLKGICKAGGIKVAELVQEKWFWGCKSCIAYFPKGSDDK